MCRDVWGCVGVCAKFRWCRRVYCGMCEITNASCENDSFKINTTKMLFNTSNRPSNTVPPNLTTFRGQLTLFCAIFLALCLEMAWRYENRPLT